MSELPISYHTFMFPFIWKGGHKGVELCDVLDNHYWMETKIGKPGIVPKAGGDDPSIINTEDELLRYASVQYFHKPVLKAMFPSENNVVRIWSFLPATMRNCATYYIEKGKHQYRLNINAIKLKIYNTGVAVMIFETENKDYPDIEDIKQINDFGRRIALPYIPNPGGYSIAGDCSGVIFTDKGKEIKLLTGLDKDIQALQSGDKDLSTYAMEEGVPNTIKRLLLYGKNSEKYIITGGDTDKKQRNSLCLEAILDDRMFVVCLIRNNQLMDELTVPKIAMADIEKQPGDCVEDVRKKLEQESINQEGYPYQRTGKVDGSIAGKLYSIVYVDSDDATCQDRFMLQSLLNSSVYSRWIEWGTLHSVTHHSLFCLTGEYDGITASVINPFLTQYSEMVLLVLVQRATIIALEHRAAELSKSIGQAGVTIKRKQIQKLMDLQENYVAFQNELLFFEVTAQEQGIEMYRLMQDQMYIEEEIEKLNNHLEILYEAANVNQDFSFNKWAFAFAVLSLLLAGIDFAFSSTFGQLPICGLSLIMVALVLIGIASLKSMDKR